MSIVLAYHGCTIKTALGLLGGSPFKPSANTYDWLGDGVYFWEGDFVRAYEWAKEHKGTDVASVVGAAIDMGVCLDLTTRRGAIAVEAAFKDFEASMKILGEPLPENKDPRDHLHTSSDLTLRFLDRAVITHLQKNMKSAGLKDYDTLRALFPEGDELYPGAGFLKKTHVQIAVRNTEKIRGVFRVPVHELMESGIPEGIYSPA